MWLLEHSSAQMEQPCLTAIWVCSNVFVIFWFWKTTLLDLFDALESKVHFVPGWILGMPSYDFVSPSIEGCLSSVQSMEETSSSSLFTTWFHTWVGDSHYKWCCTCLLAILCTGNKMEKSMWFVLRPVCSNSGTKQGLWTNVDSQSIQWSGPVCLAGWLQHRLVAATSWWARVPAHVSLLALCPVFLVQLDWCKTRACSICMFLKGQWQQLPDWDRESWVHPVTCLDLYMHMYTLNIVIFL